MPYPPQPLNMPRRMRLSDKEFQTGVSTLDTIQMGVEEFHTQGFVVLENAVPHDALDKLYEKMISDSKITLADPALKFNHGIEHTNFSQMPPLTPEFLFEEVWANRHVVSIMEHIIGPKPQLCFASSNIQLDGGTGRQAVHSDSYGNIPTFPFCVEVYLYLQDVGPENGSTEIWPGSHNLTALDHMSNGRSWIRQTSFTKRAKTHPPIQPKIPKGSICMRDLRLWHSGMANSSSDPRIMLAFIYFPPWFRCQMRMTFPEVSRKRVESWRGVDVVGAAQFLKGDIDHLKVLVKMNFTQDPSKSMADYRARIDISQGRQPGEDIPVTKQNYFEAPNLHSTKPSHPRCELFPSLLILIRKVDENGYGYYCWNGNEGQRLNSMGLPWKQPLPGETEDYSWIRGTKSLAQVKEENAKQEKLLSSTLSSKELQEWKTKNAIIEEYLRKEEEDAKSAPKLVKMPDEYGLGIYSWNGDGSERLSDVGQPWTPTTPLPDFWYDSDSSSSEEFPDCGYYGRYTEDGTTRQLLGVRARRPVKHLPENKGSSSSPESDGGGDSTPMYQPPPPTPILIPQNVNSLRNIQNKKKPVATKRKTIAKKAGVSKRGPSRRK